MALISPDEFFKNGKVVVVNRATQSQPQNQQGLGSKIAGGVVNYVKNTASDFQNRAQNITRSISDAGQKKQSPISAALQTVGQVAGASGDIVGNAVKPGVEYAADKLSDNSTFQKVATSKVGDAVINSTGNAISKYTEWARQHPEASRNLEASVNIATLLLGEKPAQSAINATARGITNTATKATQGVKQGTSAVGEGLVATGQAIKPAAQGASRVFLGDDLKTAMDFFSNNMDQVNAFRIGTKTLQNIADTASKAVKDFDDKSFRTFTQMKNNLPDIKVPNSNVVGEVKKIYKEIPVLTDKEQAIVKGIFKTISGNESRTLKGLLDLRNRLDRSGFFREGSDYVNSNKFLRQVRDKLNDMAVQRAANYDKIKGTKYANKIRQGLLKSRSDIQFIENLQTNLLGSNSAQYIERTASKLRQIISKIDDPTEFEATKNLLKELEGRTKTKIVSELEAAKVAKVIEDAMKLPGGVQPLNSAKQLLNRAYVKTQETLKNRQSLKQKPRP